MRRAATFIFFALVGTSCAAPPSRAPSTSEPPVVVARHSEDASLVDPSDASAPSSRQPEDASVDASLPSACVGSNLDLEQVFHAPACRTFEGLPRPPLSVGSLDVALTAATSRVASGESVELTIVLTNPSNEPRRFAFGGEASVELEVVDRAGARVAPPPGPRPTLPACDLGMVAYGVTHFVLLPHGSAHFRARWIAERLAWRKAPAALCAPSDAPVAVGPLAPGTYALRVLEAGSGRGPVVTIEVVKPPRP